MNLQHCFTASMIAHSISIVRTQIVLLSRREDVLSITCAINWTLFKAVPNVQQFLNFVNSR